MPLNDASVWSRAANDSVSVRTSAGSVYPDAMARSAQASATSPDSCTPDEPGLFRQIVESLGCLAVAVIVFRAFLLEGYIISTGSMAPSLLGYHKQIECPDCGFDFAFGVAFDRPGGAPSRLATCPNCGQGGIDVSTVPRNDGDQLLVYKNAYMFEDPKRWDVVVFLNPNNPNQAYVKRTVALPGETVLVRDGDVYINGKIQQKDIARQRTMRIPVYDQAYSARDPKWIPRWLTDSAWTHNESLNGFRFDSSIAGLRNASPPSEHTGQESLSGTGSVPDVAPVSWVRYYHWPRLSPYEISRQSGEADSILPGVITDQYGYNERSRVPEHYRVHDLMLSFQATFDTDSSELFASLNCRRQQVVCRIDAAGRRLDLWVVRYSENSAERILRTGLEPMASIPLKPEWFENTLDVELSTFDRQAAVAVNGAELAVLPLDRELAEVPDGRWLSPPEGDLSEITIAGYSAAGSLSAGESSIEHSGGGIEQVGNSTTERRGSIWDASWDAFLEPSESDESDVDYLSPAAFGARGEAVEVTSVKLFRDVHYTTRNHRHATERPLKLGDDEFFFLGDNSPVSLDSRGWQDPVVPRRLLVGRPLVVHLPSRPGRVKVGSTVRHIRVPDFSRIRCIR